MSSIQVLLLLLSCLAAILFSLVFKSRLGYRLLAASFFVIAAGCVVFPDFTTLIANHLGVGRGTDLLLYVSLFAGIHGFLLLYLRTRRLEKKITEQLREIAVQDAQHFGREQ